MGSTQHTLKERAANRSNKRLRKLEQLAEREEMKFSHSIQFNAVPDWSSNYISYSNLKKAIYSLEKQINKPPGEAQDEENTALLGGHQDPDTTFKRMLDSELDKVCSFYRLKELEIFGELEHLLKDAENYKFETNDLDMDEVVDVENRRKMTRSQSIFTVPFRRKRRASTMSVSMEEPELDDDSDSDAEDHAAMLKKKPSIKPRSKSAWNTGSDRSDLGESREDLRRPESPTYLRRRPSLAMELEGSEPGVMSALYDSAITLKKRIINIYVSLCELKSFIQLNQTGFKKAAKKYDKVCNRDIRKDYLEKVVNPSYPFLESTMAHLEENIGKVEKCYADIITKGDQDLARRELRLHLREHVVWERNTVWREMIGIERKAQAANFGIRQTLLGGVQDPSKARLQGDRDESFTKEIDTPVGRYRCPKWLFSSSFFALIAILGIFLVLLLVPIMKKTEQQNCLAMLVFVSLLWATEVIPLFVTSLLVPFLVVVLRIMRSEDKPYHRLDSKAATKAVFAAMWTPVIMLLLGGFTIAAALSKYHIAKMMATFVLSKAGTKARTVLVTNMFVGMFLSMWISNVAAPVLCFSIIQPILRNLPADSNMSKALILGIALASNIGGMASPIASPQNIVALQNMKPSPSWGVWFFVAQRRFQQFPVDDHHPRRWWTEPGARRLIVGPVAYYRARHYGRRVWSVHLWCASCLCGADSRCCDIHLAHRCCADHSPSCPASWRRYERAASESAGYGLGVDVFCCNGPAHEWVSKHDCNHDGSPRDRCPVFAGQAFPNTGHTRVNIFVCGRHHCGLWVDVSRWLVVPAWL